VKGAAGLVVASGLFQRNPRADELGQIRPFAKVFNETPVGSVQPWASPVGKANARRRRALNSIVAFETLLFTLQLLEMPFNSSGCFTLAHLCGLLVVLATTHLGKNPAFSQERLKRRRATSNGSLSHFHSGHEESPTFVLSAGIQCTLYLFRAGEFTLAFRPCKGELSGTLRRFSARAGDMRVLGIETSL